MSKNKKKVEKAIKNTHPMIIILGIIFLVVGAVGGFFACKFISTNDSFELVGDDHIYLELNSSNIYTDAGVVCVAYGQDESDKVLFTTNMTENPDGTFTIDTSSEGEYYIIYTVKNSLKYNDIQRVRVITIGGTSNE